MVSANDKKMPNGILEEQGTQGAGGGGLGLGGGTCALSDHAGGCCLFFVLNVKLLQL